MFRLDYAQGYKLSAGCQAFFESFFFKDRAAAELSGDFATPFQNEPGSLRLPRNALCDSAQLADNPHLMKPFFVQVLAGLGLLVTRLSAAIILSEDGYHVFPGDQIQDALQQAASNKTNKVVKVHAGEYRPNSKRQA